VSLGVSACYRHSRRHADRGGAGGDIDANDGTGADDAAIADADAVENLGSGADPDTSADANAAERRSCSITARDGSGAS
jgi:hypothetical protein